MALSGSISTNSYDGRYYTLSWSATQSIANNQSTISYTLSSTGGDNWYAERTLKVVIAGHTIIDKTDRVQRYKGTIKTGSFTVNHNSEGKYSFTASIQAAVYVSLVNCTGSSSFTLDTIPRQATLTSAPNFTDEDNPVIYYSNPAGSAVTSLKACISLTGSADDIAYRDISKTGTSYTFNLTDAERSILRNNTVSGSNSRTVKFFVTTVIGGNTYYSTDPKTFTVINCEPTLNPTVMDLGSVSTGVTGNPNILLRDFNYPKATFNSTAKKGASIISRTVTCGTVPKTADDGDWVQFNNVSDNIFTFTITDNRGNTVSKSVAKEMIDYMVPTCQTVITTDLNPLNTANINITVSGKYYNGSLGKINNSLTVEYRYRTSSGAFPKDSNGNDIWTQSSATVTGNEYTSNATLENKSYTDIYFIQTRVRDAVYTSGVYATEEIVRILPTFDWSENDFNFNVPVFKEGNPMGYYPIGGIYTSSDNTDPGELFGGTWELERRFYGGELLAYGTAWNGTNSTFTAVAGTAYGFSDSIYGATFSSHIQNYMTDILAPSSGTLWVQTKGIVGLVEANVEISGGNSGCTGIWFRNYNKNTLPSSVVLTGGLGLIGFSGSYTGASTKYFYNIDDTDAGSSFFVNPMWQPYSSSGSGSFYPSSSGIQSTLHVKAYAKGKVTYMWKRVA